MTSQEILREIQKLPLIEQEEIAASLQKRLSADSVEIKLQKVLAARRSEITWLTLR